MVEVCPGDDFRMAPSFRLMAPAEYGCDLAHPPISLLFLSRHSEEAAPMMQSKLLVGSSAWLSCRGLRASVFVFLVAFCGLARESRAQGPWEAIDIGTMFDGWDTVAHAVNDRGQVVGLAQAPLSDGTVHRRAFIWTPATGFVDLGHLGRDESMALGVNNAGQVVGESRTQNYAYRAFLWSPATGMVDIDGTDPSVRQETSTTRASSPALARSAGRIVRFDGRRAKAWSTCEVP
jgi:probable HAF family extracellular repeat protein